MKHTPTPWFRNIRANGKYPTIFAGRNQHVCSVSQQKTGDEIEANIDFIVTACNAHEDLVAALRELVTHNDHQTGAAFNYKASEKAWAAIAKAEGSAQ